MVQFLSINIFFLDFFNYCWVFQKFPFFCVTLYISLCYKPIQLPCRLGCTFITFVNKIIKRVILAR